MKRLLLAVLMVLVSLGWMVSFSPAGNEVSALQAATNPTTGAVTGLPAMANAGVQIKPKEYYLTKYFFAGDEANTACDIGFHMASMSEIQDPSKVQYATKRAPAYDIPYDQVYGLASYHDSLYDSMYDLPPVGQASHQFTDHIGWVRSEGHPPKGFLHDCDDYPENRDNQSGTILTLSAFELIFEPGQPAIVTYSSRTTLHPCSQSEPVWCVEDRD